MKSLYLSSLAVLCLVLGVQHATCVTIHAQKHFLRNTLQSNTELGLTFEQVKDIYARDIAVGPDGTMWHVSRDSADDGYTLYRMQSGATKWEKMPGSGVSISVGKNGVTWVVTKSNKLKRYNEAAKTWEDLGVQANQVSAAPDGNVYYVALDSSMYVLNSDGKNWTKLPGGGVKIVGGPNQDRWHINSAGNIYKKQDASWVQVTPDAIKATDIAIGANGKVAILTNTGYADGNTLAIYDGSKWVNVPVTTMTVAKSLSTNTPSISFDKIAVDPTGAILGVKSDQTVYKVTYSP